MGKTRSLVVCNTAERAQRLFEAIRDRAAPQGIEVWLLHSRFLPEDRARIETNIREKFGKDGNPGGSLIVVATQAIEVGLDMTSAVLHTELAPANAIVQRAGRCARYQGDEGDVYIYCYALDDDNTAIDLTESTLPYEGSQRDVICRTWAAFCERQGALDYAGEQAVLNHAHLAQDEQLCLGLQTKRTDHRSEMFSVMAGARERASRLVREIEQQRVIVHADPGDLLDAPYAVPGFGLHPGTVQKCVKDWLERNLDDEPPFRVKWLQEDSDPDQSNRSLFKWNPAADARDVRGAPLLVVHPSLAGYDPILGFLPGRGTGWESPVLLARGNRPKWQDDGKGYRLETYERHIELVYEQFQDVTWPELQLAAKRLEARCGWPKDSLWTAARLAVLLHDTGKLSTGWQGWVREWQKFIGRADELADGEAYAHTDNFTVEHIEQERTFGKRRPWHAGEGAVAASILVADQLTTASDLLRAVLTAITHHHAPDSSEFKPFRLERSAADRTRRLLQRYIPQLNIERITFPVEAQIARISLKNTLIEPTPKEEEAFLAYVLLVRALRRADQRGTRAGMYKEE